jgi:hypothetical protein
MAMMIPTHELVPAMGLNNRLVLLPSLAVRSTHLQCICQAAELVRRLQNVSSATLNAGNHTYIRLCIG